MNNTAKTHTVALEDFAHMGAKIALETALLIEDEFERDNALGYIAELEVAAGNLTSAIRIAGCTSEYEEAAFLCWISKTQTDRGDLTSAQDIAALIEDDDSRESALAYIVEMSAQEGDTDTAERISQSLCEPFQRSAALINTSEAYYLQGNIKQAQTLAREVLALNKSRGEIGLFAQAILKGCYDEAVAVCETPFTTEYDALYDKLGVENLNKTFAIAAE
jgi:tetratricopeptide (TPR) repeat protein